MLLRSLEIFWSLDHFRSFQLYEASLFLCEAILAPAFLVRSYPIATMGDAEEEYTRIKADPSISVDDLEQCLERYFKKVEFRNLQEALDLVKEANTSWKSAAKAILCTARLIGFFRCL